MWATNDLPGAISLRRSRCVAEFANGEKALVLANIDGSETMLGQQVRGRRISVDIPVDVGEQLRISARMNERRVAAGGFSKRDFFPRDLAQLLRLRLRQRAVTTFFTWSWRVISLVPSYKSGKGFLRWHVGRKKRRMRARIRHRK